MPSKSERTKQFIIEKTAPVFNAKGYAGTSLNDMMFATGLTKGSIYGNFQNKDEVALAAFDYNFQCVIKHIKSKMDLHNSVIDQLLVYPETYRNFLQSPILSNGCPIVNTSTEADDTHLLLKNKATSALVYWRRTLENQIKKGIDRNEIKPETNSSEFISIFISLLQGGVIQAKVTGKTTALNASMDFLEKLILDLKT